MEEDLQEDTSKYLQKKIWSFPCTCGLLIMFILAKEGESQGKKKILLFIITEKVRGKIKEIRKCHAPLC